MSKSGVIQKAMKKVVLLDGGMGEELFRRGMPDDRKLWSAQAVYNPKWHELLKDIHASWIKAGSRIITTNNFSITNEVGFTNDEVSTLTATAARLAVEARDSTDPTVRVWGSLPPLNGCYRPDLVLPEEVCTLQYSVMLKSLVPYVDGIICETLSSVTEMKSAVGAVLQFEDANRLPISCSWTVDGKGRLRSGESANEALNSLIDYAGERFEALLFNCGEVEGVLACIDSIDEQTFSRMNQLGIHLGAYPNRLTAVPEGWTMGSTPDAQPIRTEIDEEKFAEWAVQYALKGVTYIGGCCGIYPSYIRKLSDILNPGA
eukprot:CFRG6169T1